MTKSSDPICDLFKVYIYIFIHHNMVESTEQKEQQKSTQKQKKK